MYFTSFTAWLLRQPSYFGTTILSCICDSFETFDIV